MSEEEKLCCHDKLFICCGHTKDIREQPLTIESKYIEWKQVNFTRCESEATSPRTGTRVFV